MLIENQNQLDEEIKQGITIVDFYAEWCGPCKMLAPILDEALKERPEIKLLKVDCDKAEDVAIKYNIMTIPALLLFKDGQLLGRTGGYQPKDSLLKFIDNFVKNA